MSPTSPSTAIPRPPAGRSRRPRRGRRSRRWCRWTRRRPGTRQLLEEKGAQAVADWMLAQKQLLLTDTTMRDGHQSLLATRMRSYDMIRRGAGLRADAAAALSVECWGGATFDVAYRFLQECPWQRLRDLRARDAEPDDADAAARLERRGLHQLSRQRGRGLRRARPRRPASTSSASSTRSTGSRTCASRWTR